MMESTDLMLYDFGKNFIEKAEVKDRDEIDKLTIVLNVEYLEKAMREKLQDK